jgi:inhibitor of KinA sporulation pathway (predicted exonuclease)
MQDVMLDLETMGIGAQAAIIAIGAVEFDIATQEIGERFYAVVDLESSVKSGGIMDTSTVLWWMQQSEEARSAFARSGEHIATVLMRFSVWMESRSSRDDIRVWGNGAAFDNVILSSAYSRNQTMQPWQFWNDRCYRTIKAQFPHIKMHRTGTHHNAVDDAESQASHLIAMLNPTLKH